MGGSHSKKRRQGKHATENIRQHSHSNLPSSNIERGGARSNTHHNFASNSRNNNPPPNFPMYPLQNQNGIMHPQLRPLQTNFSSQNLPDQSVFPMMRQPQNLEAASPFIRPQAFDMHPQFQNQPNLQRNVSNGSSSKPRLCLQEQNNSTKNQMHRSIKNKDLNATEALIRTSDIEPNEECSVKGFYWTALHYAAHFGAEKHLEKFAKLVYHTHPDDYVEIMNLPTKEGYSPLMISAIYGNIKCLEVLIKCGGMKLTQKSVKNQSAKELALQNSKIECYSLLDYEETTHGSTTTKINHNFLGDFKELHEEPKIKQPIVIDNVEEKPEYEELFLKGERVPCMFCQENTGWIKYTNCCGQPLHLLCIGEGYSGGCLFCRKEKFVLINEVLFPERAFELPH